MKVNPDRIRAGLEAMIEVDDQLVLGLIDRLLADDYTGTNIYERIELLLKRVEDHRHISSVYVELRSMNDAHECPCGCGRRGKGVEMELCGLPTEFMTSANDQNNPKVITSDRELLELTREQRLGVTVMQMLCHANDAIGGRINELDRMEKLVNELKNEQDSNKE